MGRHVGAARLPARCSWAQNHNECGSGSAYRVLRGKFDPGGVHSRDRKGVVRRLAKDIANQFALTYDLRTCPVADFLNLLPPEFERWVRDYRKRSTKGARNATATEVSATGDSAGLTA